MKIAKALLLLCGVVFSVHAVDYATIGQKIWLNESGGNPEHLLFWNAKEEFPSLGIGHFIWYPKSYNGPFVQTFPAFLTFCKERNVVMPTWLKLIRDAPWNSRAEFLADLKSERVLQLRQFLIDTMPVQAIFVVERMKGLLGDVWSTAGEEKQACIKKWIKVLSNDSQGLYVLVDYVNFKGSGTNPAERYEGFGWGLQQVFLAMNPASDSVADLLTSFIDAAKKVLEQRIAHAPAARNEKQFLAGWFKRLQSYSVCL
jgi:hypothetical protein